MYVRESGVIAVEHIFMRFVHDIFSSVVNGLRIEQYSYAAEIQFNLSVKLSPCACMCSVTILDERQAWCVCVWGGKEETKNKIEVRVR